MYFVLFCLHRSSSVRINFDLLLGFWKLIPQIRLCKNRRKVLNPFFTLFLSLSSLFPSSSWEITRFYTQARSIHRNKRRMLKGLNITSSQVPTSQRSYWCWNLWICYGNSNNTKNARLRRTIFFIIVLYVIHCLWILIYWALSFLYFCNAICFDSNEMFHCTRFKCMLHLESEEKSVRERIGVWAKSALHT